ncbi:INT5 protein, partial [Podilymbus podiceps]|nr:INT5 protein [Podilymbus podiceps]
AAVHQFFAVLRRRNFTHLAYGSRLLARLSAVSPAAGKAVLQQLVEGALRAGNAELFGGSEEETGDRENDREGNAEVSLLDINRRFTAAVNFSGGVWSVFHAGVIGRGLKATPGPGQREPEELAHNVQLFLSLLLRCCRSGREMENPSAFLSTVPPDAAKAVAATLVENVCPEAAGGELAWPPEEQARGGTVERDLRICRRFR